MRVLMIEDEPKFVAAVKAVFESANDATLLMATDIGVADEFNRDGNESIEEQLAGRLSRVAAEHKIDLVLLDTDLSREAKFQTQTVYRQAFRQIGLPVCRYRKKARETLAHNFELIYRLATDGATAVSVPHEAVVDDGPENCLVDWLKAVSAGFQALRDELQRRPELLTTTLGPAGILAGLLGRPELHPDLLGYTAPNFFFFASDGGKAGQDVHDYATSLGYWLVNYILAFPGPILHKAATAAYLNITVDSLDRPGVLQLLEPAMYAGPFASLDGGHYWLNDLADLIEKWGGDIRQAPELKEVRLDQVDAGPRAQAFFCIVNKQPIPASEAASSPDWIPSGAQMARIRQDDLEQLGPMLNI
ncbi:hypothetical protein B5P43_10415 [Bacillus sp. SRB_336]|nr:hypothetical protein B5P43_10415 [Bacillus sp. SRB_336]